MVSERFHNLWKGEHRVHIQTILDNKLQTCHLFLWNYDFNRFSFLALRKGRDAVASGRHWEVSFSVPLPLNRTRSLWSTGWFQICTETAWDTPGTSCARKQERTERVMGTRQKNTEQLLNGLNLRYKNIEEKRDSNRL